MLVRRRVMPEILLAENTWRYTNHNIVLSYFGVAARLVVVLDGRIDMLSAVFSYAFLGVLLIFSGGVIVFKLKRRHMPLATSAVWCKCLAGFAMMHRLDAQDYISMQGTFEPALARWLAAALGISTNMMFIRQPDKVDAHQESLLGVRVITD
ncbi:Aste57867_14184 [Aphanomyces stellatus]|uniref:Aste57867_14184 protein n=1 Tax=Aphanomyces stellatus TaxID=120398 RepID=A0A485L296_9STRA|nr:hypothetical protein As57867_014133 [Aphanomyces stellatus]VFT91009.1 Aste57867_14184 [Aphanomyces stellatus]